ncbi:DNA polymerase [Paenibacillus agilis]|uniref:DNA-directed DNA polymerase n=1 Tax=Paenibacillus agilis TaxID=3020863 RepID=A0A559IXA8_9BACL|nr:DNA polymerase [Paenibacillus agilis]TVX92262.1 bifunctional 3'-5' exonuclease/DNA polymerase [Paenibacillus agilis]
MKLGGLFGQPKTLAKVPSIPATAVPQKAEEQQPAKQLSQLAYQRAKPGEFNITWPKVKPQLLKDYAPILTLTDLEAWLDRCIETGICGFDWETTASVETKQRWKDWLEDFKYEERKDEYLERAQEIRRQAERDKNDLDISTLTKKQRETEAKRIVKAAEKSAKEWEAKAAELDAEYEFQREIYLKTPLDPWQGDICTASLCPEPHCVRVVPIDHKKGKVFEPLLSRDAARKLFMDTLDKKILRNRNVRKIAVNLGFETKFAAKYEKYIQKPVADPLVCWVRCMQLASPAKISDPKRPATDWGLKPATLDVFGVQMGNFEELLAKHSVDFFDEIDASQGDGLTYSAEDADYAVQHDMYWMEIARQIPKYEDWLNNIEMPFGRVIGLMEYWGMRWDSDLAEVKRQEAEAAQEAAAEDIKQLVRDTFDIEINPGKGGKTNEVKHVIFELMKLPAAKWGKPTKTGERNVSLDEEALIDMEFMLQHKLAVLTEEKYLAVELPEGWEKIDPDTDPHLGKDQRQAIRIRQRPDHPYKEQGIKLLELMKKIQKYATLLSSHINGREKHLNPVSGRIHANYTPWTETGRLNSSKPNGQNVPRLDNDAFGIRNFYVPGVGKILFFIDFSGFELRILAWRAKDGVMIELFNTGGDMHKKTASEMTGKDEADVTKKERTDAKPANFGIAYGGTEHSLQTTYKTDYGIRKTLDECLAMVNAVKRAYPGVPRYQVDVVTEARDTGYAETIHGYKRLLPGINSTNRYERESAGRQAGNTPIQGTAADVMKDVQNDVYDEIGRGTALVFDAQELNIDVQELAVERNEAHVLLQHGHTDMIAQIHDEIIFEMDDNADVVDAAHAWIKARMEQPPLPDFPVKIEAEGSVGYAWGKKQGAYEWVAEKRGA